MIQTILDWFTQNNGGIAEIIMALFASGGLLEVIVRLTPTEKDNNILRTIQSWIDYVIPNRKKKGGLFRAFSKKDDAPIQAHVKKD